MTPEQLGAAITPRTRLLILNSPSNPTGASYSLAELQALGAVARAISRMWLWSPMTFMSTFIWAKEPFVSFAAACPSLYDRTVTTNGVSKAYAMTGWRIGYAAGPEGLTSRP